MGVLAPRIVTHPDIRTRSRSTPALADGSLQKRRSPTTQSYDCILRFGGCFEPRYIVGAGSLDQ